MLNSERVTHSNPSALPVGLKTKVQARGGEVILPTDAQYDVARQVYNRIHNPRPVALVRTLDPDLIFDFACHCAEHGLPLAVRGGGHHIGGGSGGDKGVVLDFSGFRQVNYCSDTRICSVQPGARLADIDRELARHGRVIPTGTVSDTGIAGLTLGGGIGWLCGPLGLTCDHLIGADVLLRDGRVVRAEAQEYSELLWALRGGGGAGIVLEMRFRTAPLPKIATGSIILDRAIVENLAKLFGYLSTRCPRELTVAPVLARTPVGGTRLVIEYCSTGEDRPGFAELLDLFPEGTHSPFSGSFVQWQSHIDADFLPPMRGYWKACHMKQATDEVASKLAAVISEAPSARCSVLIEHLHGAFSEVHEDTSAFPLRAARVGVLFAARWPEAEKDQAHIGWVRDGYSRLDPKNGHPVYANYATAGDRRAASAFSPESQQRLCSLRSMYDIRALAGRLGGFEPSIDRGEL